MLDVVRAVRERTVALDLAREKARQQQQSQPQPATTCSTTTRMASPSDIQSSAIHAALPKPPPEALAKSAQRGLAVALSLGELSSETYQACVE